LADCLPIRHGGREGSKLRFKLAELDDQCSLSGDVAWARNDDLLSCETSVRRHNKGVPCAHLALRELDANSVLVEADTAWRYHRSVD
jgi:hypothetical protein